MSTHELVVTTLLSALSATGATTLTLIAGWWQLRRTEAYRRASRWEPMAERLWQERFNIYEQMLSALDGIGDAISSQSQQEFEKSTREVVAAHRRLQVFGGSRVLILSVNVMKVNNELQKRVRVHGIEALTPELFNAQLQTVSDLQLAMRVDLGIEVLDSQSEQWFSRTKAEGRHDELRQIVWQGIEPIKPS